MQHINHKETASGVRVDIWEHCTINSNFYKPKNALKLVY